MLQIEYNCTFDRFQKFLFDEMDFNREGGMLDDENAGRNDRLWFFWHHHVSNFRGATLDNGEENNYCSSLTSNQNTSVQLFHARRSFKLSESGGL